MLYVIPPGQHQEHADILEAMYRLRYDVAVTQWGWDIPGTTPGREKDSFDTDDAAYFVAMGEAGTRLEGRAIATARLLPTTRPHMMSELFASFCNLQTPPTQDDVWECSRYLSDARLVDDKATSRRARIAVNLGMIDFALSNNINQFIWLTHQLMYGLMIKAWVSEPLGLPHRAEGEEDAWIAGISKIDMEAHHRVAAIYHKLHTDYDPMGLTPPSKSVA